jgi:hypothetical protein
MFSVSKQEMDFVGICISYPEKFWKVANTYARSKKSWIPAKNLEKLELVIKQTEEKRIFLEKTKVDKWVVGTHYLSETGQEKRGKDEKGADGIAVGFFCQGCSKKSYSNSDMTILKAALSPAMRT